MHKHELPKDEYGIFYAANCYLILYTVEKENYSTQVCVIEKKIKIRRFFKFIFFFFFFFFLDPIFLARS